MAVGLPAAFLEPYASTIASYTISELQKPVDISAIAPRVAGIDPFRSNWIDILEPKGWFV